MNRRRALFPPAGAGLQNESTGLASNDVTHRHANRRRHLQQPTDTIIDLTPEGYGREGLGRRRRPAGGAKRGRSAWHVLQRNLRALAPRKLSSVAPTTGGQHRPALIYVFFLPKLKLGFGSELGSGEIWNAEKA